MVQEDLKKKKIFMFDYMNKIHHSNECKFRQVYAVRMYVCIPEVVWVSLCNKLKYACGEKLFTEPMVHGCNSALAKIGQTC